MKNLIRHAVIVFASASMTVFLTGCVGVFVSHVQHHTYDRPSISDKSAADAVFRSASTTNDYIPADKLRKSWGEPEELRAHPNEPNSEVWTYRFGRFWCGVIPCVVIPVPLVVPTGRERVDFVVTDGRVTRADVTQRDVSGGVFSLFGPDGPGCY